MIAIKPATTRQKVTRRRKYRRSTIASELMLMALI